MAYLGAAGVAFVLLIFELSSWSEARDAAFVATWPKRQVAGEAWIHKQGIAATITCYSNVDRCDVVPKDSRAPFYVMCGSGTCSGAPCFVCSLPDPK